MADASGQPKIRPTGFEGCQTAQTYALVWGVWLVDEVVARIEERIAAWTFLPSENGESIQILHYKNGEKYEPHYDYFHDKNNQALGGHRIATVLMYLSNIEKGGETIFPNAEGKLTQHKDETASECAKNGYAVKPVKGDALLFFSLHPDATTDPDSLHGSCPVIEGQKWSATKWIHVRSFENSGKQGGGCEDENVLCSQWAAVGECAKNPNYMVGTKEAPGFCRKSCNVCVQSGINELYPPVGHAEAAALVAAAASLAAFLSASAFSVAARSTSVDMVMMKATRT
ncbi:Prolyl 4-hydroxylase subunit alpha-2 [Triticum urartu]|uniref:procollagen-proline 4-dioxygenase n=1 Tax=Triticum urartu TaxID=4572 RepID=M8AST9_TRIUA|nr:Prolyl 4-hydroxylase subunit alpha-2 [Triticum urartu]